MERTWLFESTAITAVLVDFLDPALAHEKDIRERGVRLEVRPMTTGGLNTIYSSPAITLEPAIIRIDLLESAPHEADRMHFHPGMVDGEPGDRTFDKTMGEDPVTWLRSYLENLHEWVGGSEGDSIAAQSDDIVQVSADLLAQSRLPWPDVTHDERGLVVS